MTNSTQARGWISGMRMLGACIALMLAVATQLAQAQTYTLLHSFTGGADGGAPRAGLVLDAKGNLYGTASAGGNQTGAGVVFKVNAYRKLTVLHAFTYQTGGPDGSSPYGGLIRDSYGNLYGTTAGGGTGGYGTVFKLTKSGEESILYSFSGGADGGLLYAGLVMDGDEDSLYGTTNIGGALGFGTVFEVDPTTNKETVLYSFSYYPDGENPYSPVTYAGGHIYGTAYQGGTGGYGTVFKLGRGKEIVLHNFTGNPDGGNPFAGLIRDSYGNLYGTTIGGGTSEWGTVFKVDSTGVETVLYSFIGKPTDGEYPMGELVRDAYGNLYGTTSGGGKSDLGTVFKLSNTGEETVLHNFTGADGMYPYARLVRDAKGRLYGTTRLGGPHNAGVVFKINP